LCLKLKENPRLGGVLSRLAFVAQPNELSPAMTERLLSSDGMVGPIAAKALHASLSSIGVGEYGGIAPAMEALGPSRARRALVMALMGIWASAGLPRAGIAIGPFLAQSAAMGCVASRFFKSAKGLTPDQMFAFGVVLHVGYPLMGLAFGEPVGLAFRAQSGPEAPADEPIVDSELRILQVHHGEAVEVLGKDFGFSATLVQAAPDHHAGLDVLKDMAQLLALSELVAHQMGYDGGSGRPCPNFKNSWAIRMGLKDDERPDLKTEIETEIGIVRQVLGQIAA
jgi:hypothetical protein